MTLYSHAGLLDFDYLNKAKSAYEKGDYEAASKNWDKVQSDEATYDKANALYKQKKYEEALTLYQSISDEKLAFEKLHNMGNAQAQLGKTDDAIKSYEEALKIKEDKDTKFNLELLKKKKKQDKKNKDKKNNKDKKDQKDKKQNKDNKKNQDQKNQDKNKENEKNKSKQDKQKEKDKKEAQKKKEAEEKKKKEEQKAAAKPQDKKNDNPPISDMEERKWQKQLDQKGLNTLMLPIRKGDNKNETTPW